MKEYLPNSYHVSCNMLDGRGLMVSEISLLLSIFKTRKVTDINEIIMQI